MYINIIHEDCLNTMRSEAGTKHSSTMSPWYTACDDLLYRLWRKRKESSQRVPCGAFCYCAPSTWLGEEAHSWEMVDEGRQVDEGW